MSACECVCGPTVQRNGQPGEAGQMHVEGGAGPALCEDIRRSRRQQEVAGGGRAADVGEDE